MLDHMALRWAITFNASRDTYLSCSEGAPSGYHQPNVCSDMLQLRRIKKNNTKLPSNVMDGIARQVVGAHDKIV